MPKPPAFVQSRNTKRSESGLLNLSIAAWRKLPRMRPSILSNGYLEHEVFHHKTNSKSHTVAKYFIQNHKKANQTATYQNQLPQYSNMCHGYCTSPPVPITHLLQAVGHIFRALTADIKVKVKQSHYRLGQALRVPGGWGSQISRQSGTWRC